jgi:hypothetical protein
MVKKIPKFQECFKKQSNKFEKKKQSRLNGKIIHEISEFLNLSSPKGLLASKCDVGNCIFSKSYEFFQKLFGNFLGSLWIFFGNLSGGFIWRIFLGEIFWEKFFG